MLSVPHLVIIFLVALLIFGPEKLPELARKLGKATAEIKRATDGMRAGFEEHMRELERDARLAGERKRPADNTIATPKAEQTPAETKPETPEASPAAATASGEVPPPMESAAAGNPPK
jgi:sec-independent protein translocase protein TatB